MPPRPLQKRAHPPASSRRCRIRTRNLPWLFFLHAHLVSVTFLLVVLIVPSPPVSSPPRSSSPNSASYTSRPHIPLYSARLLPRTSVHPYFALHGNTHAPVLLLSPTNMKELMLMLAVGRSIRVGPWWPIGTSRQHMWSNSDNVSEFIFYIIKFPCFNVLQRAYIGQFLNYYLDHNSTNFISPSA